MALNYVSLVFTEQDAANDPGTGLVTIAPTATVVAAGQTVVSQQPVTRSLSSGTVSVSLVACDNTGTTPAAGYWAYTITLPGGSPQTYLVNYASGATQQFSNLVPAAGQTVYSASAGAPFVSPMTTLGDMIAENSTPAAARLAGPTGAGLWVLTSTPSGGVAQLPAWAQGFTLAGYLAPKVTALTFGTNIAVDASQGNVFTVTLTSSAGMIKNPTNPVDGQIIRFRLTQDATGGRTVAWDTGYDFGSGSAPTLTSTASKTDIVAFEYVAALSKWAYLGAAIPQGF